MHIESLSYVAVQPNTGKAATPLSGDSLTIKNGKEGTKIQLLDIITKNQTAGYHQITSPLLHDSTRGIRALAKDGVSQSSIQPLAPQLLYPQDTLTVTITGSNTALDDELGSMLIMYEDLPGVNQNLINVDELLSRMKNLVTINATITMTNGGAYEGAESIISESDLLHANTPYAILGMQSSVLGLIGTIKGPDTSNMRIGVPAEPTKEDIMQDYFVRLSQKHNTPLIPVIDSANRASTFFEGVQDEDATDLVVNWVLAELNPS